MMGVLSPSFFKFLGEKKQKKDLCLNCGICTNSAPEAAFDTQKTFWE